LPKAVEATWAASTAKEEKAGEQETGKESFKKETRTRILIG